MQRSVSLFMMQSLAQQTHGPTEKLRKLSSDVDQLNAFQYAKKKQEPDKMQAWGATKWDPKSPSFNLYKFECKSPKKLHLRRYKSKNPEIISPSRNEFLRIIQQKLIELQQIHKQAYLKSEKNLKLQKQANLTQSTCQKQLTQQKQVINKYTTNYNFKIRKSNSPFLRNTQQNSSKHKSKSEQKDNKTHNMTMFQQQFYKHQKQKIPMINYPLFEEKRRKCTSRNKIHRLHDFVQTNKQTYTQLKFTSDQAVVFKAKDYNSYKQSIRRG